MDIKDWRGVLFAQGSAVPTYLPEKFYLPGGDLRHSYKCTLDDITLAGYTGPVEQPPLVPKGYCLEWDSSTLTWGLKPCATDVDVELLNTEVVQHLNAESQLCGCHRNCEELSPQSKKALWLYRGQIQEVLENAALTRTKLTWDDVPPRPSSNIVSLNYAQSLVSDYFDNFEQAKTEFESFGAVFLPSGVEADLVDSFPDGWVMGNDPLPSNFISSNFFVPSGYCVSDELVSVSGYYFVESLDLYYQKISDKLERRNQNLASGFHGN